MRGISVGSPVAVFGEVDVSSGGIVGASVVDAGIAGYDTSASFLSGIVDSVDRASGVAVVSGKAVNYTALLANGMEPSVGDMMSIAGRDYGDSGLLMADPDIRLER